MARSLRTGLGLVALGLSACVESSWISLPPGTLAGAQTVVFIFEQADGATAYRAVATSIASQVDLDELGGGAVPLAALVYACTPETLGLAVAPDNVPLEQSCLPGTERRLELRPGEEIFRASSGEQTPRACKRCEGFPLQTTARLSQSDDGVQTQSAALIGPEALLLGASLAGGRGQLFRVEFGSGPRVVPLQTPPGFEHTVFGPLALGLDGQLWGMGDGRLWRLRLEGDLVLPEAIGTSSIAPFPPRSGSIWVDASADQLYLADGYGGLWAHSADRWSRIEAQRPVTADGSRIPGFSGLSQNAEGTLIGVGVGSSVAAFQVNQGGQAEALQYFARTGSSTSLHGLPGAEKIVGTAVVGGVAYVASGIGEVYALNSNGRIANTVVGPSRGNASLMGAMADRLILVGGGGAFWQVFPETVEACEQLDTASVAAVLSDGPTLYLVGRDALDVIRVHAPPIIACSLPALP